MKKEKVVILLGFLVCMFLVVISIYDITLLFLVLSVLLVLTLFLYFLRKGVGLKQFVLILIPMIVLSPSINIPGIAVRLDDLWMVFGAVIYLLKLTFTSLELKFKIPEYTKIFLIFIVWVGIVILISSYREPLYYGVRDWLDVYKNLKLLILLIIVSQIKITAPFLKKFFDVIMLSLFSSALFGFAQYFNFASLNSWLSPYFVADSQVKGLEVHRRIVGTYANPNVFGVALLIGLALSLSKLLESFKFKYAIYTVMFLTTLFLTKSRTALIVAAVVIVFIFFKSLIKSKRKLPTIASALFSVVILYVGLQLTPEEAFSRTENLSDLSQDESFQFRLNLWADIFELRTMPNILTGTGPTGNLHFHFDNEWLFLLTAYGIFGLILILSFFLVVYWKLGKINVYPYNVALQSLLIGSGICMITESVFQQLQLMPLIVIMVGVLLNPTNKALDEPQKKKRRRIVW